MVSAIAFDVLCVNAQFVSRDIGGAVSGGESAEPFVRFVGYVPLSIVFWAASLNNLVVIWLGIPLIN
jgi:hypothetical protein